MNRRLCRNRVSRYHRRKHAPVLTHAHSVYRYLEAYHALEKEHFLLLTLDGASRVINTHIVSIGTLNQSLVHPREVFYPAIQDRAAAIILAHNHPSGECMPSTADRKITTRLKEVGVLVGIEIADHLILTQENYYSFQEDNTL